MRIWISAVLLLVCPVGWGAEHVTLKNGFAVDCVRREVVGDKVRLYTSGTNYMDVAGDAVVRVDVVAPEKEQRQVLRSVQDDNFKGGDGNLTTSGSLGALKLTKVEMGEMLSRSGVAHNIDADLLASVVRAESGGQVRAVSRTGAKGLMQLMPGTAKQLGVEDSFKPEQNIAGGTAYLDALLTRYHDNVALALAAYNAGPGAVDKYRGVPPYRETQAYVARVIREFNRLKMAALVAKAQ